MNIQNFKDNLTAKYFPQNIYIIGFIQTSRDLHGPLVGLLLFTVGYLRNNMLTIAMHGF